MIKYKLLCKNCELTFDSWFASSSEYDRLKKKKLINCHNCNSQKIDKSVMAPKLIKGNLKIKEKTNLEKFTKFKKKINDYQKFIKNNFKYVGENFAQEARSIHYNNKKKSKNIYGNATAEEVAELKEEGIEGIESIPWIKENEN
mgnify:CR=1 FL=1